MSVRPRRLWPLTTFASSGAILAMVALSVSSASAALPNDGLVCAPEEDMVSGTKWLRTISLDVRGDVPDMAEYEALRDGETSIDAMVDEFLLSDGFTERVLRQHRSLLWNNVSDVRVLPASSGLGRDNYGGGNYSPYYVRNQATNWRGLAVPCNDTPAVITNGVIQTEYNAADGTYREGYVMVTPYWNPNQSLKVCAFDAQETIVTPGGFDCNERIGGECGCGPNLRWCRVGNINRDIGEAMTESLDRLIGEIIAGDRSYLDLFTAQEMWVNGPLAHFLRHQTGRSGPATVKPSPVNKTVLPPESELPYTAMDTWVKVPLDKKHAGILTHPAFLLRFQTQRARANRIYNAFLCQPFQPPEEGLPPATDAEALNPDLQKRAGCKYCHALLEPAGAFWGRWAERGAGFLSPSDFPSVREDCFTCATTNVGCSTECRNFYTTQALSAAEVPYLGMLKSYTFLSDSHTPNVEAGPSLLMMRNVANNNLPMCVARKTAEWLLGRDMTGDDQQMLEDLAFDFATSDFSYQSLVRAIVLSETYRRVR